MYSIVEVSGHQYRVQPGDVIDVQKLTAEEGDDLTLDQVMLVSDKETKVGLPLVEGASVKAKVIRQARDRKVIVFKRRAGAWRRKKGHRQHYTSLLITEVSDGSGNKSAIDKDNKFAKKHLK